MLTAPCLIRRCVATDGMPAAGVSSFDKRLCVPRAAGCEWLYVDLTAFRSTSRHAASTRRRQGLTHLPGPPGHSPAVGPVRAFGARGRLVRGPALWARGRWPYRGGPMENQLRRSEVDRCAANSVDEDPPSGRTTLTVGTPWPARTTTMWLSASVGFDSRWMAPAGTWTKSPATAWQALTAERVMEVARPTAEAFHEPRHGGGRTRGHTRSQRRCHRQAAKRCHRQHRPAEVTSEPSSAHLLDR
jgi:hypothetical protein